MLTLLLARKSGIFATIFLLLITGFTFGQTNNCYPSSSITILDINNVSATIPHSGNLWWDFNDAGYEVPKGSGIHSMLSGGFWIGGIDAGGQLKVAAQTYRQTGNDFFPGPLDQNGNVDQSICNAYDFHWKVNRSEVDNFLRQLWLGGPIGPTIPPSILHWPGRLNPYARGAGNTPITVNQELTPFCDFNGDGIYDPTQGDYPDFPGDQAIFYVFNDKGNIHTETGGAPMGVEVQALVYAFQSNDYLNNATFYRFKVINKSGFPLGDTYLGLWVDNDLGCFTDDYVGCDTALNLAYAYNGDAVDEDCATRGYGSSPPVLAVQILGGAYGDLNDGIDNDNDGLIDEGSDGIDTDADGDVDGPSERERNRMSHFMYYNNDFTVNGNPESPTDFYGYLKGIWKDGSPVTSDVAHGYGGSVPANYMYPGNPADAQPFPNSWSECSSSNLPADRRFVVSSGPSSFPAGSVQTLDFAVLFKRQSSQIGCAVDIPNVMGPLAAQTDVLFEQVIEPGFCRVHYPTNTSDFDVSEFTIYPNPANDQVLISGIDSNIETLTLYSGRGKLLSTISLSGESSITIDVKGLPAGLYHIMGTSAYGILSQKLIKL